MISLDKGTCCLIDLTQKQTRSVFYNDAAQWLLLDNQVDYFKTVPATPTTKKHTKHYL